MKKKFFKKKYILLLLLIAIVVALAIPSNTKEELNYNTFTEMVNDGEIKELILTSSSKLEVEDKEGNTFTVDNPRSSEFKEELLRKNVKVTESESLGQKALSFVSIIFPFLVLGTLIFIITKNSPASFMSNDMLQPKKSNINFSNIAGNKESTKDMEFLIEFLKDPKKYSEIGAVLPKGVLFDGPPGTGKTLTAQAMAGEAGVPFMAVSGSDFVELYVGLGASKVRRLFDQAKKNSPCIVFIDEIDSLASKRGHGSNREQDQTLNALLTEMDGFDTKEGVIIIAATNRADTLDPAILRPGRFDRQITINLPDLDSRKEILNIHAKGKKISKDVDMDNIAKMTIGFSGASIASLLNEAAIIAVNRGSKVVETRDIDNAYIRALTKGDLKEDYSRDEDTTKLIAYHEAGHALLSKLLTNNNIPKVSIAPTTSGAGGFTVDIPEEKELLSKNDLINRIMILYGGRAAEELIAGPEKITTGASNDISVSTSLIRKYFKTYGMSSKYGLLDLNQYEKIDITDESIDFSNNLYNITLNKLKDNRVLLDSIASRLIEKESIDEEELDNILKGESINEEELQNKAI